MATIALFFYLFVCFKTQLISVESLQVSPSLHTSFVLSASSSASRNRLTHFYLHQATDDDGSSSSVTDEEIDFDWKAIADYVFDESIDSAATLNLFQGGDVKEGAEDDQSLKDETPHLHSKPIILFDGVCNLCNGGVNFAIDYDKSGRFRFVSLQSNVAKALLLRDGKDPKTLSDVVLVTSGKNYYSSEAVARIMAGLDMPILKILGVLGQVAPSFARNVVYKIVSKNRFILGESDSCRMDFDGEYTSRFVSDPPESISANTKEEKEDK